MSTRKASSDRSSISITLYAFAISASASGTAGVVW